MTFQEAYDRVRGYSSLSRERLRGLWDAIKAVDAAGIAGDMVECGTFRGGSAAMLALASQEQRRLWLVDSFAGLPEPTEADPPHAHDYVGKDACGLDTVLANLSTCGVVNAPEVVAGWYADTLPCERVKQVAVLHIDCDWYESVRRCLDAFWLLVPSGGVIQIDDYGHWDGARKAVDEFLLRLRVSVQWLALDYTGRQFRKP